MLCIVCMIALIALTSTAQGQNHTSRPSCDGYCLNGGQCPRTRSVRVLRCRCSRGYIGKRCETRRVPCPEIDPRPSGKCKGKLCSDDRACVKRGEQCCHNSCGRKLCTNINGPGQQQNLTSPRIRKNPERRRKPKLNKSDMTEKRKHERIIYTSPFGKYGVTEDPSSPSCKGFCLNGGQCVRNFPKDSISCTCHKHYKGERCETYIFSCPEIIPISDGKCEGTSCSIDHDCVNPLEECCPSACGGKICTNVNAPLIRPRSCAGYCLNGGRCWNTLPDHQIFCYCPKGYTGYRCEKFSVSCPEIHFSFDGKCEGNICSNDQDCSNPGEQCCPSACGGKLCSNVIESATWIEAVRQRKQKLDSMVEHKEPEGSIYYRQDGSWGMAEDPNSPSCQGFCLNGGQCVRNFPDDFVSCNCPIHYKGERCKNYKFTCPEINRRSDEKCKGKFCLQDKDCVNPGEQCCPNACGRKLCWTNGIASVVGIQQNMTTQRTFTEAVHQIKPNLDNGSLSEHTNFERLAYRAANGRYGLKEDPNSPSCKGFCLNGGDCVRNFPDDYLSCVCHIYYTGKNCQTYIFSCPEIKHGFDGKCEGTSCSIDHDCVNPQEECCPSACGGKICTNVNAPRIRDRTCDGYCLNGGRCWQGLPYLHLFCYCPKGYTGHRCETFRGPCPEIDPSSVGKCEGIICSNDQDCGNPGEQCCPSACGGNLCSNVIDSAIWTEAVRLRKQILDNMSEVTEPEGWSFYREDGSWGVNEDPNSPFCKGLCLNGGSCRRNFPDDFLSCTCPIYYKGKRCETYKFSCPEIVPRSDGKCEGTSCSIDHDCVNYQEECCPSACGGKICTNVNSSIIRQRLCPGFCFNGGRCRRRIQDRVLSCKCPKGYIGNRCETFRYSCPEIDPRSGGKCEGHVCSNEQDCVNPEEQCCPSACGGKLCTNVNASGQQQNTTTQRTFTEAVPETVLNLDMGSMSEDGQLEELLYFRHNGTFQRVDRESLQYHYEDPSSPPCKDFCVNGGQCVRVLPDDFTYCDCHVDYTGFRCELLRGSCPVIYPELPQTICQGEFCSNDQDCVNPAEKCCPSACGDKRCTDVYALAHRNGFIAMGPITENLDKGNTKYQCRYSQICRNGGRCWSTSPDGDSPTCDCPKWSYGKRCENTI